MLQPFPETSKLATHLISGVCPPVDQRNACHRVITGDNDTSQIVAILPFCECVQQFIGYPRPSIRCPKSMLRRQIVPRLQLSERLKSNDPLIDKPVIPDWHIWHFRRSHDQFPILGFGNFGGVVVRSAATVDVGTSTSAAQDYRSLRLHTTVHCRTSRYRQCCAQCPPHPPALSIAQRTAPARPGRR